MVPALPFPEPDLPLLLLLATVLVAGVARGMSGFGTGMIVAPVAGALYGPKTALVIIVIMDLLPVIPLTLPAMRHARWREVVPVLVGLALLLPAGVAILRIGDPLILRWVICVAILACATGLWRGVRYRGPRNATVSLAVGGIAGTLSGIASIPGPPVIMYWLASPLSHAIVRANLLVLFFLAEMLSIGNLWIAGLFERPAVMLGLAATPAYFLGLLGGWRLFGLASEEAFRRTTLVLILLAALLALPAAGPLFAMLGRATV